jgi:hypothetical protein
VRKRIAYLGEVQMLELVALLEEDACEISGELIATLMRMRSAQVLCGKERRSK